MKRHFEIDENMLIQKGFQPEGKGGVVVKAIIFFFLVKIES